MFMKKLFKIISLKIQQFIWKRYYYSLPLQYKNVTILEGLSLQLHEQRNESDKLSKTLTKVFNEFQKKFSELETENKQLKNLNKEYFQKINNFESELRKIKNIKNK